MDKVNKAIPVIRIFDVQKAIEFYVDWLGFSIDWQHRFEENLPAYIQISKEALTLHLTEHHGDCSPGAKVYVLFYDLKHYHQELMAKNYHFNKPGLEKTPWGSICMEVTDPFNNKIVFDQPQ